MDPKEVNFLPVPEANALKQQIVEDLRQLSVKLFSVDSLNTDKGLTDYSNNRQALMYMDKQITTAHKEYGALARKIMRDIEPYVVDDDKAEYYDIKEKLHSINVIFRLDELEKTYSFINRAAKNSNLTELGTKSTYREIVDFVDIEEIRDGLPTNKTSSG